MKRIISALLSLSAAITLAACGSSGKLDGGFLKEDVIARGKDVVLLLNASDYASVENMVREDVKSVLSAQVLETALDGYIKNAGAFSEFIGQAATSQKDTSSGQYYAVAVLVAKYANASYTFTISFDKDMKIVGLYMK